MNPACLDAETFSHGSLDVENVVVEFVFLKILRAPESFFRVIIFQDDGPVLQNLRVGALDFSHASLGFSDRLVAYDIGEPKADLREERLAKDRIFAFRLGHGNL